MNSVFEFTPGNKKKLDQVLKRYPRKRAAMLPVLHLVQEQEGFVSEEAEDFVARVLDVPVVDVREVLSFYTLYFRKPMGKHHIRLCTSIACWVRGSERIQEYLTQEIGVEEGSATEDGRISWEAVPDCLGACELAPMLQLDKYFEGPLDHEAVDRIMRKISEHSG